MPPANSPTDTRPSTPPNPNLYFRQLEEAIYSPVPDLASTLNLNPAEAPSQNEEGSRTEIPSVHNPRLSGQARGQRESRTTTGSEDIEGTRLERAEETIFARRSYLTEAEFQNWSSENRRRAIMQSQRARTRMSASPTRQREGQRQNYATTGPGPIRESLYDWAVTVAPSQDSRDLNSSDDSDEDMEGTSTAAPNTDIDARRDLQRLERALQSYRSARNALRLGRTSDMGTVPTAGALRAFWNEETSENVPAMRSSGSGFSSQYQQERQERRERFRRHRELIRFLSDEGRRLDLECRLTTRKDRRRAEAFTRVRNSIRYLSQLRHTGVEGGLELARQLGLDSLYESEEANIPSDLPMHVNSLPIPQYSSWLEPGMVWHGLQSTDRDAAIPEDSHTIRRQRQRELFRRTLERRRELGMGNLEEGPVWDAVQHFSDPLQDNNGRWGSYHPPQSPSPLQTSEADHWPVKVIIHSADYDAMTLTGTMSASHLPDKLSPLHRATSPQLATTTSMSSFFTGEIIDFRRQPLETESEGRSYRVGGLDTDARYWARLGPFRKEIEKVRNLRGKSRSEYQQDSRLWDAFRKAANRDGENKDSNGPSGMPPPPTGTGETGTRDSSEGHLDSTDNQPSALSAEAAESRETEDDEVMARSLGSAKWIEEKLGREWILMRWKERCFVTPTGSSSNVNPTRTIFTMTSSSTIPTGPSPDTTAQGSTSWGLTISGFYYIALNRLTGEIDGLYFDPGSQPYQALKMVPDGTPMRGVVSESRSEGSQEAGQAIPSKLAHGERCICGCGEQNCKERVGLKKWFPSVEFR
ncbi:uncharacterized protein Z518_07971 [Rhinocladiella mackenziei CBS 650.93]|uniref:Rhinocladiella mackenziei CBS 650.93 unplaced genomic scaffold supercont1.6, whole genome shotgun sequence n=1 Tax=Rhinocladiella mackenziei CBS 650.93 TaxID=1442369 RepID=A0A0D2FJD1_9EURO|nr:uncharacterized protein Z518_07971 [Rhinocladiella mackenziei CBS 650.93]KIX02032.1 hypothetical protein Z518_07971 [Rhinocladiella mackenziei CBS 650.93]